MRSITKLTGLLGVVPAVLAHDLHPEYASTRWALEAGLPCVAVQHHHAHVASCLADNGRSDRADRRRLRRHGMRPRGRPLGRRIPPRRPRALPADWSPASHRDGREEKPRSGSRGASASPLCAMPASARSVLSHRAQPSPARRDDARPEHRRRAGDRRRPVVRCHRFDPWHRARCHLRGPSRDRARGHRGSSGPFTGLCVRRRGALGYPVRGRPASDGTGRRARRARGRVAVARFGAVPCHARAGGAPRLPSRSGRARDADRRPFGRVLPESAPQRGSRRSCWSPTGSKRSFIAVFPPTTEVCRSDRPLSLPTACEKERPHVPRCPR